MQNTTITQTVYIHINNLPVHVCSSFICNSTELKNKAYNLLLFKLRVKFEVCHIRLPEYLKKNDFQTCNNVMKHDAFIGVVQFSSVQLFLSVQTLQTHESQHAVNRKLKFYSSFIIYSRNIQNYKNGELPLKKERRPKYTRISIQGEWWNYTSILTVVVVMSICTYLNSQNLLESKLCEFYYMQLF